MSWVTCFPKRDWNVRRLSKKLLRFDFMWVFFFFFFYVLLMKILQHTNLWLQWLLCLYCCFELGLSISKLSTLAPLQPHQALCRSLFLMKRHPFQGPFELLCLSVFLFCFVCCFLFAIVSAKLPLSKSWITVFNVNAS